MKRCLIVLALTLILCSCNKEKNGETQSENKIRFWHFWSEPNQRKIIQELVSEFEKSNNCKVEITELSWNDGKTKLFAAFNAGNAPDVLELGSDWVAQFSAGGVLMQMDSTKNILNKFVDFSHAPCLWKDQVFALPWIVDTRVLFYNKDLVKATPDQFNDYENLLKIASNINGKDGKYGWGTNGSDRHRLYKKIVTFFWTYGGDIFDSTGKPVLNSPNNAMALEKYAELSRAGIIETQRQIDAAFVEGKIGFWLSGGWLLEKIKNENPKLNFGVVTVPNAGSMKGISFAGGEYLAVNAKAKNTDLSKKFVSYMTDGVNAIKFCKVVIEAGFPADKSYFQDEFYKSQPERMIFAKQLESARMTPVHPKWLDIEEILEDAAVEVMYGKSSAQQALNSAQAKVLQFVR